MHLLMYKVLDMFINNQRVYHKIWSTIGNDIDQWTKDMIQIL